MSILTRFCISRQIANNTVSNSKVQKLALSINVREERNEYSYSRDNKVKHACIVRGRMVFCMWMKMKKEIFFWLLYCFYLCVCTSSYCLLWLAKVENRKFSHLLNIHKKKLGSFEICRSFKFIKVAFYYEQRQWLCQEQKYSLFNCVCAFPLLTHCCIEHNHVSRLWI